MNEPKASLIITTFNWPQALDLVFRTILNQTIIPAEVIVADDGSHMDIESIISKYRRNFPIVKIWQPDKEFRAARARNLALARVNYDYVIFIDGDCLLPPNFLEKHLNLARDRTIVAGGRYLVNASVTQKLLDNPRKFQLTNLFTSYKFKDLPLGPLRSIQHHSWQTVRSCNFGAYTRDICLIGGFDENYIGWGREDSDMVVRLIRSGLTIRSGRFGASVAHLHHMDYSRNKLSINNERFRRTLTDSRSCDATKSLLKSL